ncbi:MAG: GatB/YqeY domain-containing protein [Gammaproteobacteria bacterium]|nr:GatB/YqeY domain-containing protein [Gammaproteobacteria bacterium]
MTLKDRIKEDMKGALRSREQGRLEAIRMLLAAIQRREVDERITLDDAQVMAVIEKLVRQGRDSVEQFRQGGRQDLVDKESRDIAVWESYLPEPLSEAQIDELITKAIAETGAGGVKDMGKVVASLRPALQGRADMGKVSSKIKLKLTAKD